MLLLAPWRWRAAWTFIPWTKVADRPGTRSQSEVTLKPACHSKHAMAHMQNPQDMWTRSLSHVKLLRQSHRVRCEPLSPHCLQPAPRPNTSMQAPGTAGAARPLPAGPDQPRSHLRLYALPLTRFRVYPPLPRIPDTGLGTPARICHASVKEARDYRHREFEAGHRPRAVDSATCVRDRGGRDRGQPSDTSHSALG